MRVHGLASVALSLATLTACDGRIGDEQRGPSVSPPPVTPPPVTPPPDPRCERPQPPAAPRLQRLTFAQYDATVRTLVGLDVSPSAELGPEVDGITGVMWSGIRTAADDVAARAMADGAARARIVTCTPSGDGAACAREVVTTFGRRAYRRALTEPEVTRYLALYTDRAQLTANGTFEQAIEVIVAAVLQSPAFLLRVERSTTADGTRIALGGLEMASRLSYALWNGPPDEALLAAAERGDLDTQAGVAREAERMLTSAEGVAKARTMMRDATRDWLGMVGAYSQFWSNTQRDPALFPQFYPGIDADFREEVLRFVEHVTFERDGTFADLFASREAVVNDRLAAIYGVAAPPAGTWAVTEVDAARPGLLTRVGFVGSHGRYGRGSLIFRGAFVLTRLMCQELGSPPAGADATPLPDASATARTTRERIAAMTAGDGCKGCHTLRINPAGFALEAFDGIGRLRAEDNGVAVDTTGELFLDGETRTFTDAASYAAVVGASRSAQQCWVQRFADFTWNDHDVELGCAKASLAERLADPSISIKDALVAIVSSDVYRFRSTEEVQ